MANRYKYQFEGCMKPRISHIEGFVSIGTGGQLNTPPLFPYTASGVATGGFVQTGFTSMALMPGQVTGGVPTGWQGGFSGCLGLLGAGVNSIVRIPGATGAYRVELSDDWCRLDDLDVSYYSGATGFVASGFAGSASGIGANQAWVTNHTVGLGNSVAPTGGLGSGVAYPPGQGFGGPQKNCIYLQFQNEIPSGGGFWIQLFVRDALEGPQ